MGNSKVLETVRVELGERSYDIEIGTGTLTGIGGRMKDAGLTGRAAVVTNETVSPLYSSVVMDSLKDAGYQPELIVIPDGEEYKSLEWASKLYDSLLEMRYDRRCSLVALGGGVIGDLTGFVAATYMRGIPFVQVPTTLLSQVDSSVGGKTGVNHPLGKNMIGAFYQPAHVCADIATLNTLPSEEFVSGMAEVVKYGVIYDGEFFKYIEDNRDAILAKEPAALAHVIKRSCEIKAAVVAADERESGLRAILNYGHTIGHAVEMLTNYTGYRHGEAVSMGMVVAARLAHKSGLCGKDVEARVLALLSAIGLPVKLPELTPESIMSVLSLDKKAEAGRVKFVLPRSIGEVVITAEWKDEVLAEALRS